jgi:probable F420-dependent oxidoreductase
VPPVTPTGQASPRPFRFGVQSYAATSAEDWRTQARTAEALGYSAFHLADHVLGPGPALSATNHPVQNVAAVPAMAVAAEATSTISIGCRVFCIDYRNPVMLAKEAATLDMFSDGRLELGLGAGWLQGEYEAMGVHWDSAGVRLDRLEETIGLVRAAFNPGELNIDGQHVHAVGFEAVPKPIEAGARKDKRDRPPIMIGGGAKRVLGIAGRHADIVSLNFDNSSGKLGPSGIGTSTAELTNQKLDWVRAGAGDRFGDIEIEIGAYFTAVTNDRDAGLAKYSAAMGLPTEAVAEHPHALIGSVDFICDLLEERRAQYGISYVTVSKVNLEAFAPVVERMTGR